MSDSATTQGVTQYMWTYYNSTACNGSTHVQIYLGEFRWYRTTTSRSVANNVYNVGQQGYDCNGQPQNGKYYLDAASPTICWACGNSSSTYWTRTYSYSFTWPLMATNGGWSLSIGANLSGDVVQGATVLGNNCTTTPLDGATLCLSP
jgi:hypothetical protein